MSHATHITGISSVSPLSEVVLPAARFLIVIALAAVVVMVPLVARAGGPAAEVSVAVTGVASDATEDNGQRKLARSPDGTLFLIYAAPDPDAAPRAGSKYSLPGDPGDAVLVARSDDGGATWITEAQLSREAVPSRLAAIAVGPDGAVHASWVDFESVGHVWHAERVDGVWQAGEKVSPGPLYAGFPALAVSADAVHLLWYAAPVEQDIAHGSLYEIRHTINTGEGWSEPVLVSTNSMDALNPTVVQDRNGVVHAAWYQVGVSTYRANYAAWEGRWQVPRAVSPLESNATGVAIDVGPDGAVHLVWEQVTGDQLGIAYSRFQGGAWSEIEILSERGARDPVIASDDLGSVFAVWSREGEIESRLLEGSWGDTNEFGPGGHPMLLPGGVVGVAWTRPSGELHEIVVGTLSIGADTGPGAVRWIAIGVLLGVAAVSVPFVRRRRRESTQ